MKKTATKKQIQNLVTAAMLMGVGIVLPIFTGQIPQIGNMLLPMHLPVLICGLICGWQYGGIIGFLLPLLRYMSWRPTGPLQDFCTIAPNGSVLCPYIALF